MKPIKKRILGAVAAIAAVSMMAACGGGGTEGTGDSTPGGGGEGQVYYLSFKPEQDAAWQDIAQQYTDETGIPVKIVTAAQGTYEQTLKAEMAKSDAPTLFQINGPVGGEVWKDYAADLSGTDFYDALLDKTMAVEIDGSVIGVPYVVEGYGIIYNQAIMDEYFALDGAVVASVDEINNFDTLKQVSDDMQAKADDLGIKGVFASTSMKSGDAWRWDTHLANLPIFYEYRDAGVTDMDVVEFSYGSNYQQIFDLYLTNSTIDPNLTPSKAVTDSMAEFALGEAAMVQNGNWAWGQVSEVAGNTVTEDNVKMMPIYMGVDGEEEQSIAVGTENFFSINSQASEADQQASIDFVNWLVSSDAGKAAMVNDLGFIPPFSTFSEDEQPSDPLAKQVVEYMSNDELYNVAWNFTTFPSKNFKNSFADALTQYATGQMEWADVETIFVDEWAAEKAG